MFLMRHSHICDSCVLWYLLWYLLMRHFTSATSYVCCGVLLDMYICTAAPSPAGWNGRMCCQAMTASCMACAQGVTLEELCQDMPATKGCKEQAEGGETPSAVNTVMDGEESGARRLRWVVGQHLLLLLWTVFFVQQF